MIRASVLAFLLDAVLVVAFAATGRASHDSDVLAGLWHTSWPFLAGLLMAWVAVRAWRSPTAIVPTGLVIWVVTVVGGMLLRALSGQGTALPFVVVATLTLLVLLIGWRLIARGIRSLRSRGDGRPRSRDVAPRA
jgi:peptidoglycan/LPS O-acetylase OafA/YrhL